MCKKEHADALSIYVGVCIAPHSFSVVLHFLFAENATSKVDVGEFEARGYNVKS